MDSPGYVHFATSSICYHRPMPKIPVLRHLDPKKIAKFDADMWRSYYNHQFLKLAVQLYALNKYLYGFGWFSTLRLSYYSGWAAADYRINKGKENYPRVLKNLNKLYETINQKSPLSFDAQRTAELELEWWDIHRYPEKYKKTLEQSLAEAIACYYSMKPAKFKEYARYRAIAMQLPGHEGDRQPNPPDYKEIEALLIKAWSSLFVVVEEDDGALR